jgi:hypothetical protein
VNSSSSIKPFLDVSTLLKKLLVARLHTSTVSTEAVRPGTLGTLKVPCHEFNVCLEGSSSASLHSFYKPKVISTAWGTPPGCPGRIKLCDEHSTNIATKPEGFRPPHAAEPPQCGADKARRSLSIADQRVQCLSHLASPS